MIIRHFPEWTLNGFGDIHFTDLYKVRLKNDPRYSVDYLTRRCLSYNPFWVKFLLRIRDALVKPFGLKAGQVKDQHEVLYFEKGTILVYFHVSERNEETIVLEEKDKHLNFRILAMVINGETIDEVEYYFSTLVHFNNIFGRVYFTLIRPFHSLMLIGMFNYLKNSENAC